MIISQIIGGLGNQMFQHAVGRSLALDTGQLLSLDVSLFSDYKLHQGFELLRVFDGATRIASDADVNKILGWQSPALIRRVLRHSTFSYVRSKSFVVEPCFNYWPGIRRVRSNCYLSGYWQSEKYFEKHAIAIRNDFTFRPLDTSENIELAAEIKKKNAIGLHIRRGDYVNNSATLAVHGICSIDYYQTAVRFIADLVENPHVFIFSDDIKWAEKNLNIALPCTYIDHNHGKSSYIDMQLMAMCKNNIIANSTFSWWGAWLNPRPEKIVIAPKQWFASGKPVPDLYPDGWIVL